MKFNFNSMIAYKKKMQRSLSTSNIEPKKATVFQINMGLQHSVTVFATMGSWWNVPPGTQCVNPRKVLDKNQTSTSTDWYNHIKKKKRKKKAEVVIQIECISTSSRREVYA